MKHETKLSHFVVSLCIFKGILVVVGYWNVAIQTYTKLCAMAGVWLRHENAKDMAEE